ncbi:NAD-dependent epimerase/dehydratase family protein [soil metagenome]
MNAPPQNEVVASDERPRRVVVSGGAGFIGSHLVDQLCDAGHEVVVVDNLDPAAHDGPPDWLNDAATYVWEDVRDPGVWKRVLPGTDAVSHQAAKVGLGVDLADIRDYVSANDEGTATMLWAMNDAGWNGRLVVASSMVVYGEGRYECAEHGVVQPAQRRIEDLDAGRFEPHCPVCDAELAPGLVEEDAAVDPRNVYAATKLHQEHLGRAFAREHDVAVCALRYHNVYGARMPRDTPYAGVASIFRSQLESGERPQVFEDGGQRRDFVHVQDVARANVLALTDPEGIGAATFDGALNVASGHPITLLEMAHILSGADGRGLEPEVVGRYRLGDVRHVVADPARARTAIGFAAQVTPSEGLVRFASDPLRRPPATA